MTKSYLFLLLLLTSHYVHAQIEHISLKPIEKKKVKVKEPSDICLAPDQKHFFIVSDDGLLVKTNEQFEIVQKSSKELYDPEAVYADEQYIYVVEERTRNLQIFDLITMEPVRTLTYPYNGGRNKGFEAFTFNKARQSYMLITEKEPIWIFELDKDFKVINQVEFAYKGDISAATYHKEKLWLLSDEAMEILRLHPKTYAIEKIYKIPVLNPEGLCFLPDGRAVVVSDDMEKAFFFSIPE